MGDSLYDIPKAIRFWELDMGLPHYFRECVIFLYSEKDDDGNLRKVPRATGFLIHYALDTMNSVLYLVTALHVVNASRRYGKLYLGMPRVNEKPRLIPIDQDDFVPSNTTDVAVLDMSELEFEDGDSVVYLPFYELATDEYMSKIDIREGDDISISGLFFPNETGLERNVPIFRFGKISLSRRERVEIEIAPQMKKFVEAYLIEAVSWGGESGSPVFMEIPLWRSQHTKDTMPARYKVVGLVYGHFPISVNVEPRDQQLGSVELNSGIMIVIPSQAVVDVLEGDADLMKHRDDLKKQIAERSKTTAIADFATPEKSPFTRDDFIQDLNKVVRKKSKKSNKHKPKSA